MVTYANLLSSPNVYQEKYHILPNELLKVDATVMVCLEVELW